MEFLLKTYQDKHSGKSLMNLFIIYFLICFIKCDPGKSETLLPVTEYCEGETYKAECPQGEVIMMHTARFGLMYTNRCFDEKARHCEIDVIDILDGSCSGRQSCTVNVVDIFQRIPEQKRVCLLKYRGFLEAAHKCVKVLRPSNSDCTHDISSTAQTQGYISGKIDNSTKCGSSGKPWIIKIAPEQRMNIILYDFAAFQRNPDGTKKEDVPSPCRVYVVIKEEKVKNSDTICGQFIRQSSVYASMSDTMQIRIMEKSHFFLLKYEAIGCGSVNVPQGGWVKRTGDEALIGCEDGKTEWKLQCDGKQWVGQTGNCTQHDTVPFYGASSGDSSGFLGNLFGSHWLAILAISAIAITVAVCILIAGIIYIKRKHVYISTQDPSREPYKYGTAGVPKPPQQGQVVYNGEGLPYRPFDPNDHEYLKTIERQRLMLIGQHPQQHFATMDTFRWPAPERQEVEHIYELPKFETDPIVKPSENKNIAPRVPPPLPQQQFELDPRISSANTNSSEGNRNVNNRSV